MKRFLIPGLCLLGLQILSFSQPISPLLSRGYTLLPFPQKVKLGSGDVQFTPHWRLDSGTGTGDEATQLIRLLADRFHLSLSKATGGNGVIHLAITPNAVMVSSAADRDKAAIARQAYRLEIEPHQVTVTGNSATGLFYGVETFVQLLKKQGGKLWLPEATIEDWPDTELRIIYWDDAHHLEHLADLKKAIRQAAFYKINGFAIKLQGHFQYKHAQPVVEPYALSPAQLQELTYYGLKYHVQLIPYLDGPAHDAFILKHPEYKSLREYPDNNYEFCATNPKTYQLLDWMFQDLLDANQGGKYFVLSTDEPYYVGLADNAQCHGAEQAKQLGSVGKLLGEFITKTAGYLHDRGRRVIFWGEYPLKPGDIPSLPSYLINGEVYGPRFDSAFRTHGIRQMVYTSTEGVEPLFPNYYLLPPSWHLHQAAAIPGKGTVQAMVDKISSELAPAKSASARANRPDLMGVFVAGWGDEGLNPATFWLGYATGPAAGWNREATNSHELERCFYSLFYGRQAINMGRLYQLMSQGARFWGDSWETGPSAARKPIWGNSYGPFHPPRPAHDQYLPPLPVPSRKVLRVSTDWRAENARRIALAGRFRAQNDELLDLLYANVQRVRFHRYNLAVFLSIAGLYRQNLTMIEDLGQISDLLRQAERAAEIGKASQAVASLDRALNTAESIRVSRNRALHNAAATWYESWFPRVAEANGRTHLNAVDDVKDHLPVRTLDMSYLVYRELLYPLGRWANAVVAVRNAYAANHHLPTRDFRLDWENTSIQALEPGSN
ncbi:MAG TPA: beta-N-acetylhexosaminidase [Bryobacteraceae bacterium]